MLQPDFTNWLLSAETPSIRYLTLLHLLDLHETNARLQSARQAIMDDGPVPAILACQTWTGQWANEHSYYTPKYFSTHWSLTLLTELCVDPDDARFQRGVEFMLTTTAQQVQDLLAQQGHGFSCFWGNLLRYALHAGRVDDPRVRAIVEFAVCDITDGCCRCKFNDDLSCAWGVVRTLWGLAALPSEHRSVKVQAAIDAGIGFVLESFSLIKADYPTPRMGKIHPVWFKLNFPLFYQADMLFTLRVLAELDALDHPCAIPALNRLEDMRQPNGRWRGSSPYRQRTWRELGNSAETARWVSLQAATILKAASRL